MEKFNVNLYKIASFEITDHLLIDRIASTKKPIILSTGMSSLSDILRAKKTINKYWEYQIEIKKVLQDCQINYKVNEIFEDYGFHKIIRKIR